MFSINGNEFIIRPVNSHLISKFNQAASSVTTHGTGFTISIIIDHLKIKSLFQVQKHESVGANSKMPVTNKCNLLLSEPAEFAIAVINDHKIVSRSLVF